MLHPLANVLAFHHANPSVAADIFADIQGSGEFDEVWRPAPGWTAARAPLPSSTSDGGRARAAGLLFAEGRDVLYDAAEKAKGDIRALSDLIARSPEQLGRYAGDFGFVQFQASGAATVVRSCGGLVPFYVHHGPECTVVSTRLGDMVRYLPVQPEMDPFVNALWTTGHSVFPDGRTFLDAVSILGRGRYLRIDPGRSMSQGSYWNPRHREPRRPSAATAREHSERLRALLIRNLERDLHPDGGNLLTLSGGVDSSSLAALATLRVGRSIGAFSLLPPGAAEYAREMSYIQPLADRCRFDRRWEIRLQPDTMVRLLPKAPPVVFHVIHPALCALPGVTREWPVRVFFGGEFADEVCGSARTLPDWAAATSTPRLVRQIVRRDVRKVELRAWLSHRRWRILHRPQVPLPPALPDFVRADLRAEYAAWLGKERRRAYTDCVSKSFLARCTEVDGWVPMNWEATSAVGVRRSLPFMTREILELAFECHPEELVGGADKKLLRSALKADVPALNLNRSDKGGWGASMSKPPLPWDRQLLAPLDRVIRPAWFPRPPESVAYSHARGLLQLVLFAESCVARRMARPSESRSA